jgi:hypothetical protein
MMMGERKEGKKKGREKGGKDDMGEKEKERGDGEEGEMPVAHPQRRQSNLYTHKRTTPFRFLSLHSG